MTVKELMERVGMTETGRAIAYIKDGLDELNMLAETHIDTNRVDITKDQRMYDLPSNYVRVIDVRCKNHLNSKDEYKSIPRAIGAPINQDTD